ncbi:MAG: hypothetical protein HY042_07515 [Spirochaetia bacterium]|nr:hypothetical protein [Spirochaetia bacterium]
MSDAGNRRIQKFSHDGKFIASFGADESGNAPENPAGIFADDNGNIFVADMDAPAILMFDTDGNRLMEIRSDLLRKPHGVQGSGDELLIADEGAGVLFYNRQERSWRALSQIRSEDDRPFLVNRPLSVRSDESRNLYVAEFGGERVTMIVPRGLRISNLDMRIQRVDIAAYPEVAVFLTVRNRLGHPLPGISRSDVFVYENDSRVSRIRTDNIEPFNHRTNISIVQENSDLFAANFRDRLESIVGYLTADLHITDRIRVVRTGQFVREVFDSKDPGSTGGKFCVN